MPLLAVSYSVLCGTGMGYADTRLAMRSAVLNRVSATAGRAKRRENAPPPRTQKTSRLWHKVHCTRGFAGLILPWCGSLLRHVRYCPTRLSATPYPLAYLLHYVRYRPTIISPLLTYGTCYAMSGTDLRGDLYQERATGPLDPLLKALMHFNSAADLQAKITLSALAAYVPPRHVRYGPRPPAFVPY
eukprot:3882917-Rhodomonas_salina.3